MLVVLKLQLGGYRPTFSAFVRGEVHVYLLDSGVMFHGCQTRKAGQTTALVSQKVHSDAQHRRQALWISGEVVGQLCSFAHIRHEYHQFLAGKKGEILT